MGSRFWIVPLLFCSLQARAAAGPDRLYLGAGAAVYNMGKTTAVDDASTSMIGEVYLPLTLGYRVPVGPGLTFVPSVSYTPIAVKTTDNLSKTLLMIGATGAWATARDLELKGGLGLLGYTISGPGGTVSRSNGVGTTTFALPGTSSTSRVVCVDLGLGYALTQKLRMDVDAAVAGALSTKRAVTAFVSLSWGVL